MDLYTIIFYVFVVMTLFAAGIVVFTRHIVRAAFALLFAFFGVAGLYVFLLADFLAVAQLLIYIGGILVLILFGVMLTSRQMNVDVKTGTIHIFPAIIAVAAIAGTLIGIILSNDWTEIKTPATVETTAQQLGEMLLSEYVLPFEITSVVLMVALVGAVMIARRDNKQIRMK